MATEKRLIWGDIAENQLMKLADYYKGSFSGDAFERAAEQIAELPTVDAVEVIRCKDCKYWKPGDSKGGNSIEDLQVIGGCKWTNFCRRETDFCSFGERKDNG